VISRFAILGEVLFIENADSKMPFHKQRAPLISVFFSLRDTQRRWRIANY
jgi:hypothetical protein